MHVLITISTRSEFFVNNRKSLFSRDNCSTDGHSYESPITTARAIKHQIQNDGSAFTFFVYNVLQSSMERVNAYPRNFFVGSATKSNRPVVRACCFITNKQTYTTHTSNPQINYASKPNQSLMADDFSFPDRIVACRDD